MYKMPYSRGFTMNKIEELANLYVAHLRTIYLTHQNNHWLTKGANFYGNHSNV